MNDKKRHNTNDAVEIKKIINEYYQQLYSDSIENLGEVDKFLIEI